MSVFTTQDVAEKLGTKQWCVRRLFENGELPEPDKFAGRRAIPARLLPKIKTRLQEHGWIPSEGQREAEA